MRTKTKGAIQINATLKMFLESNHGLSRLFTRGQDQPSDPACFFLLLSLKVNPAVRTLSELKILEAM